MWPWQGKHRWQQGHDSLAQDLTIIHQGLINFVEQNTESSNDDNHTTLLDNGEGKKHSEFNVPIHMTFECDRMHQQKGSSIFLERSVTAKLHCMSQYTFDAGTHVYVMS